MPTRSRHPPRRSRQRCLLALQAIAAGAVVQGCGGDRTSHGPGSEGTTQGDASSTSSGGEGSSESGGNDTCPEEWSECPDGCVPTDHDSRNCGACDVECAYNGECVGGECIPGYLPCSFSSEELSNCTAVCQDAGGSCAQGQCGSGIYTGRIHYDSQSCFGGATKFTESCDEVFPDLMTEVSCCCEFP